MVAALLENNRIQVGNNVYPKSVVSLKKVQNAEFLELHLIANGETVDIFSTNPSSSNYGNTIFEENGVQEILKIAESNIRVFGDNISFNTVIIQKLESASTRIVNQLGHNLTAPSAAYVDPADGKYKPSDRNDPNKFGVELVLRIIDVDNFEVATFSGEYRLDIPNAQANSTVYVDSTPGQLTAIKPGSGETLIVIGWLSDAQHLHWSAYHKLEESQ